MTQRYIKIITYKTIHSFLFDYLMFLHSSKGLFMVCGPCEWLGWFVVRGSWVAGWVGLWFAAVCR